MKFYETPPNFSIVLPGPCNANCPFCFWKETSSSPAYLDGLIAVLNALPPTMTEVSLTGGEPLMSPHFEEVLSVCATRFKKVVITTNGTHLLEMESFISSVPNAHIYINISRHHHQDDRNKMIFNSSFVPSAEEIGDAIALLSMSGGIPVRANCVLCDQFNGASDVHEYLKWCRATGFNSVSFRKQHGTLNQPKEYDWFREYRAIDVSHCPVCETITTLVGGIPVLWKSSVAEPSETMEEIYELVLHPNCNLTLDWQGMKPAWPLMFKPSPEIGREPRKQQISLPRACPDSTTFLSCGRSRC